MELKRRINTIVMNRTIVLIAPLWNWNPSDCALSRSGTRVLIAPLWNWNNIYQYGLFLLIRSNRTFMELKHQKRSDSSSNKWVLIAPLWNWNYGLTATLWQMLCSNRTFMELKPRHLDRCNNGWWSSNRTFMELKHSRGPTEQMERRRSNRTFMELKLTFSWDSETWRLVLIAPLWNWNSNIWHELNTYDCSNRTFMELKLNIKQQVQQVQQF